MTQKKPVKEPKTEKNPPPPLAEILIQVAINHASENNLKLGEVMGHFEIAKTEIYSRNVQAMQAQAQDQTPDEPAEDDGKEDEVVSFQDEAEDKAEK